MLLIVLIACIVLALCANDILRERRAPQLAAAPPPAAPPSISVIIPARNEAAQIGACLAGLAAQSARTFEVIVVDDDSADDTAAIAWSYAPQLPQLQVLSGAPLPPQWAGKCWACWQAAGRARGEWLLFLDADVRPQAGLLAALTARAAERRLDMITLMPLLLLGSFAERLALPAFQTILYGLYPLARVSDPASSVAFANGQCVFVRRATYDAVDGHRAVRAEVLEDAIFGQIVKRSGARIEAAAARDLLHVRMYTGWPSLAEGLSKHAVAGARNGGARSAWVGTRQMLLAYAPWYMLLAGLLLRRSRPHRGKRLIWTGGLLAYATMGSTCWLFQRRYRVGWTLGLWYPLGLAAYFALAGRAFWRAWRGRGVMWKGRELRS